jgi:predicted Fe-S protein YdhL (DUF1289 family)
MSNSITPCTGLCTLDRAGVCRGCFRTRAELRAWPALDDAERAAIVARVRPLLRAAREAPDRQARQARAQRLDKKIAKAEKRLAKLRRERAALALPPPPGASVP